jgi:hypothetical protein
MADVKKEIAIEVSMADKTSAGTQSAKQRLRELQKTLTEMALAGQEGTEAFRKMEVEAGKLKDQIGDTSQRIKNLASDTRNIDTFVAAVQGITAGFQIAQGAAALFGNENEDLQKALLKVQGAMALANGVQQIANLLNKDSILITQGQTAAQALYATAVGTSTGAMKAFRIALLATGIGAAVAALGLLIAKWDELTAAVRRFLNLPDPAIAAKKREEAAMREEAALSNYRYAYEQHTQQLIDADKKRQQQLEERQRKEREARLKRFEEMKAENEALIKMVQDTNLMLFEEQLNQNSRMESAQIAAMQKEAKQRQMQATMDIRAKQAQSQREKDLYEGNIEFAKLGFDSISGLSELFAGKTEKSQERAFNINKAANIAQALMDTYTSANAAYKSQLTVPDPSAPIRAAVAAGFAVAAGLGRVALIAKTKFDKSGGTPSAGGSPSGAGAGQSAPPQIFANPQTTNLGTGELSTGQGQNTAPMRAYVVERDIAQTGRRVRRLEEFATIGG